MIDTEAIRKRILQLAVSGKLLDQNKEEGTAAELIQKLSQEINGVEPCEDIMQDEIPYQVPSNWRWCRLSDIGSTNIGLTYHPEDVTEDGIPVLRSNNIQNNKIDCNNLIKVNCQIRKKQYLNVNDILICARNGSKSLVGKSAIYHGELGAVSFGAFMAVYRSICYNYVYYYFNTNVFRRYFENDNNKQINQVTQNILKNAIIPLPPLKEQKRITEKIEEVFEQLELIDELQTDYIADIEILKSKIIDAGIQGKLTNQLLEDGTAERLDDVEHVDLITDEDKVLDIPDNWSWIRLGWAMEIERGCSPRPIKAFMTDTETGINWIKIGDVEKDGKYIFRTKEKIKPEGANKSRKVYPGDFLLTNSMSYGRPYISKIEGCIHDGWLLLRNSKELFDLDYLYWLLSSKYVYSQFCKKASGATVDNLNKEKVASAVIPLPPINEQKRIVYRIEELLQTIQTRGVL